MRIQVKSAWFSAKAKGYVVDAAGPRLIAGAYYGSVMMQLISISRLSTWLM